MASGAGAVFLKGLVAALVLNVAAHAALNLWSSYLAAVVASVAVAFGVWLGHRFHHSHW